VKLLVEALADPSAIKTTTGETPLHLAAQANQARVIEYLLDHCHVDVNARDMINQETALHCTTSAEIIELLCRHQADPNVLDCNRQTPLHVAQTVDITRALLDGRADVSLKDHAGKNVLHLCTQVEQVPLLVAARANVNERCHDGQVPLWYAIERNDQAMVEMLASQPGIDLEAINPFGESLIAVAMMLERFDCIIPLVRHDVDPNSTDSKGRTALHAIAADPRYTNTRAVTALVAAHANVDALTPERETPLYLAAQSGNLHVCRALLQSGANRSISKVWCSLRGLVVQDSLLTRTTGTYIGRFSSTRCCSLRGDSSIVTFIRYLLRCTNSLNPLDQALI